MAVLGIHDIRAREVLDSRGDPTIEVTVMTEGEVVGVAAVPSGASTGVHEAHELRDGDKERYDGKGVLKAVEHVNTEIRDRLRGMSVEDQRALDASLTELDGTSNKHRLGANALLGVSLACARAAAAASNQPLYRYLRSAFGLEHREFPMPLPMMNVLNGGVHADNNLDIQEFMVVPKMEIAGRVDIRESVRVGSEVFHALGRVLKSKKLDTDVGNEGGYAPTLDSNEQGMELLMKAVIEQGFTPGQEVSLALDVAASEFYRQGAYHFGGKKMTSGQLIDLYEAWGGKYPLVSIEDGLAQDDWHGWTALTERLGERTILVGDDLFVTHVDRLELGFQFKAANAVIIKPNQVGTLSETMDAVRLAQEHKYTIVVSHRSGETNDTFVADLAVAVSASYLKAGSTSRGERVAKYNRLMEIADETGA